MKVIAIDDEPLALNLIESYIKKTPNLDLAGSFDNPISAIEFLNNNSVDLIFIDIQMPDLTGIEFVKSFNKGAKIIFTTAYEKYALEGFKLDAIDYLLKPFGYDEFLKATQKARKIHDLEQKPNFEIDETNGFLFVKSEYKIRKITFSEILYIEGLKDYVKIFIKNEPKAILSLNSLKNLEAKLPTNQFMRVHKSFIVNLSYVETVERLRIVFGKEYIPVGDQYKEKFQEFLDKNFA